MKYAVPAAIAIAMVAAVSMASVTPQAIAAPADPKPKAQNTAKRACFRVDEVRNWKDAGGRSFNFSTSRNDVYTSRLLGVCPDIDWSNSIAIKTRFSSLVCEGDDAQIIVPRSIGSVGPQTCDIDKIRKLSADEVSKLDKGAKP